MKVKFENWKKVHDADDHAIFKNMQGHELKVSKKALSPELKSQMEEIEVHTPKPIAPKQSNPKLEESKKESANYDDGGEVSAEDLKPYMPSKKEEYNSGLPPDPRRAAYMANKSYNAAQPQNMADGGEALDIEAINPVDAEPVEADVGSPEAAAPTPDQAVDLNQMDAQGNIQPAPESSGTSGSWDAPAAAAPQSENPAQQMQTQPETLESGINSLPGVMGQKMAAAAEAEAIGKQGKQDAATLGKSVQDQQVNAKHFQDQYDSLNKERLAHIEDIKNGQINPENYWKDHSKVSTAIGLILGGFNPSGHNGAVDFLNKQMDRNLEAQKANLGSKENLLSANLHQFGNMRDATDMTRIMQGDIVSNQLKMAAAKAQDPIAKARALGIASKIDSDHAMLAQQMAMRQTLQKGAAQGQDPASFVPWIVPAPAQKDVFDEIKNAQNTRSLSPAILNAFDEAAKPGPAKTFGHSAGQKAFSALINTTVQEKEGTARMGAFDSIEKNMRPQWGDNAATLASKKDSVRKYLAAKSSAPIAKGYGIDLDQFKSTSTDPVMQLAPQQQQYVQWARQNPNDPRSKQVLKKLGVQ